MAPSLYDAHVRDFPDGPVLDRFPERSTLLASVRTIPTRLFAQGVAGLIFAAVIGRAGDPLISPAGSLAESVRLKALSLEDLMQLDVSTVSRKTEPWWYAPGAVDVVTDEDIRRSGVMTIPDALRLATGVHVGQANAQGWAVSMRGFNVLSANKINVQLDGRNLFTPFFSGVTWSSQDTLLEDIDRIEVVRGPAGALWGNYAMNGFIQILTKPAWDTQGALVTAAAGTELPGAAAVRYGGMIGSDTFYRVFLKYTQTAWTYNAAGRRVLPATDVLRAGFRSDTRSGGDAILTLEADAYTNKHTLKDRPTQERFSGQSLLARWRRSRVVDSDLQVTAYYDGTWHLYGGNFLEKRHTLSTSAKARFVRGPHDLQTGIDVLVSRDHITSDAAVLIEPPRRTYHTSSAFVEDTVTLVPNRWVLTGAAQVQWSAFSGAEFQPTARLSYMPEPGTTFWAALSRAVRTPVRLDADLVSRFGGTLFFEGNDDLKPEKVNAAEFGIRRRFNERVAMDLSVFANRYDDVRTYESKTSTYRALPWTFRNTMNAESTGIEATLYIQPTAHLFLKAGYRYLDLHLTKDPGSGDFLNGLYEGNDPRHVFVLSSRTNLGKTWTFDTTLRAVSRLPNPAMPSFFTGDVRLAWSPRADWEIALIGQNLFDPQHPEFTTPNSSNDELARSVTLKTTWRF